MRKRERVVISAMTFMFAVQFRPHKANGGAYKCNCEGERSYRDYVKDNKSPDSGAEAFMWKDL